MGRPEKDYLGDAVYARADGYGGVVLTTEDGVSATNTIVLEDTVIRALENYLARMKEEMKT